MIKPHFLKAGAERVFVLARVPLQQRGPAVLVVPPFGEEMNKSRRMVTALGERLLEAGQATITVDLVGTGDSDAEFVEASWQRWIQDVKAAIAWAQENGWPVATLLGIRMGCALAIEAAEGARSRPLNAVFWQPVLSGRRFLDMQLRIGVAAAMARGRAGVSVEGFRRQFQRGEPVEIAGYNISSEMATALDGVAIDAAALQRFARVDWFELVQDLQSGLPEASRRLISLAEDAGLAVHATVLRGMPFWAATEIVLIEELLAQTLARLGATTA